MRRGATLLELLIVIIVAALVAVPMGLLISRQVETQLRGRDETVAISLARFELESLASRNNYFDPALALGTTVLTDYQGQPYTLQRVVECLVGSDCNSTAFTSQAVKRVIVRVYRPSASNPLATQLVSFVTYWTKHVTFGS